MIGLRDYAKLIENIRLEFPMVDEWTFRGITLWPYLRLKLYLHYKNEVNKETRGRDEKSLLVYFKFVVESVPALLRLLLLPKNSSLFISSASFREQFDHKYMDRLCDPILETLYERNENGQILEFASNLTYKKPRFRGGRTIAIQPVILLYSLFKREKTLHKGNVCPENYEDVISNLEKATSFDLMSRFSKKSLLRDVDLLLTYKAFYLYLFKFLSPKFVFLVCYYTDRSLAAIMACKELGIKTVDIQHGVQSEFHLAYKKCVNDSYFIPDIFWCWDTHSLQNIRESYSSSSVFLGGNPWMNWFRKRGSFKQLRGQGKVILYSLQPIDNCFPDDLIKAIDELFDFHWYIRVHPHQRYRVNEIEADLKSKMINCENIYIEEATELPLPYLLAQTDIHLTNWSSVAIEASEYLVPTIFLHSIGKDLFKNNLPDNLFYSVDSASELFKVVMEIHSQKDKNNLNNEDSLIASKNLISEAINGIFENE